MKAIELDAEVTADHAIHLKLPNEVRAGRARIIVLYETEEGAHAESEHALGNLDHFLTSLPRNAPGRDREEIAAKIEAERASWD